MGKQAPREGQRKEWRRGGRASPAPQEEPGKASWRRQQLSAALKDGKNLEKGLWDSLQSIRVTDRSLDSGSPPRSHIDAEPREGSTDTSSGLYFSEPAFPRGHSPVTEDLSVYI